MDSKLEVGCTMQHACPAELRSKVAGILRKYFEYDDNGEPNKEYDPAFDAASALDEIHSLVGHI